MILDKHSWNSHEAARNDVTRERDRGGRSHESYCRAVVAGRESNSHMAYRQLPSRSSPSVARVKRHPVWGGSRATVKCPPHSSRRICGGKGVWRSVPAGGRNGTWRGRAVPPRQVTAHRHSTSLHRSHGVGPCEPGHGCRAVPKLQDSGPAVRVRYGKPREPPEGRRCR